MFNVKLEPKRSQGSNPSPPAIQTFTVVNLVNLILRRETGICNGDEAPPITTRRRTQ